MKRMNKNMLLVLLAGLSSAGMLQALSGRVYNSKIKTVEKVINSNNPSQADLAVAGQALNDLEVALRKTNEPQTSDRYKRYLKADQDYQTLLAVIPAPAAGAGHAAPALPAPASRPLIPSPATPAATSGGARAVVATPVFSPSSTQISVYQENLLKNLSYTKEDAERVEAIEDLWEELEVPKMANNFDELSIALGKFIALADGILTVQEINHSASGQALMRQLVSAKKLAQDAEESGMWNGRAISTIKALNDSIQKAGDKYKLAKGTAHTDDEEPAPIAAAAPISDNKANQDQANIYLKALNDALTAAEKADTTKTAKANLEQAQRAIFALKHMTITDADKNKLDKLESEYKALKNSYDTLSANAAEEQPAVIAAAAPIMTFAQALDQYSKAIAAGLASEIPKTQEEKAQQARTLQENLELLKDSATEAEKLEYSLAKKDLKKLYSAIGRQ